MKKTHTRLLSILLTLCMVLTLVPALGITASASNGTESDPYIVSKSDDLLYRLRQSGTVYIQLVGDIDADWSTVDAKYRQVIDTKYLDLNGHTVTIRDNYNEKFTELYIYGNLTISDSSAGKNGGFTGILAGHYNGTISMFDVYGSLTINAGSYKVSLDKNSYQYKEFGSKAYHPNIISERQKAGTPKVVINGGSFTSEYGIIDAVSLVINGGSFYSEKGWSGWDKENNDTGCEGVICFGNGEINCCKIDSPVKTNLIAAVSVINWGVPLNEYIDYKISQRSLDGAQSSAVSAKNNIPYYITGKSCAFIPVTAYAITSASIDGTAQTMTASSSNVTLSAGTHNYSFTYKALPAVLTDAGYTQEAWIQADGGTKVTGSSRNVTITKTGSHIVMISLSLRDKDGKSIGQSWHEYFVTLASTAAPVITKQPTAQSAAVGSAAIFTVAATSPDGGTLSYHWETDFGAGWYDCGSDWDENMTYSGDNTATLRATSTAYFPGYSEYRCVVTNTKNGGTEKVYTNVVKLTCAGQPLSTATVTRVVAPVAGVTPVTDCVLSGSGYTLDDMGWYNVTDKAWQSGAFETGKTYRVMIYLKPTSGYVFADAEAMTATVNGNAAEVLGVSGDDAQRCVFLDFTVGSGIAETGLITIAYTPSSVDAAVGGNVVLKATTDLDLQVADKVVVQWYKASGNIYGTGTAIFGANTFSYTVPTDAEGTAYYYCVITAEVMGEKLTSESSDAALVRVTVAKGIPVITKQPVSVDAKPGDTVTFTITATGEDLHYQWHQVDAGPNVVVGTDSPRYTIKNADISRDDGYDFYCVVSNKAGTVTSAKAHLTVSNAPYVFPFTDVPESAWYYESVRGANKMGLINGTSATTYSPGNNMTVCEAMKLAACMHQLYNDGEVTLTGGSPWYKPYYDYCRDNGIISTSGTAYEPSYDDYMSRAAKPITRSEYVFLFSRALPDSALPGVNTIPDNSIPDVKMTQSLYDQAIYKMYRSGILCGSDVKGTFNPDNNIQRSEVAAILIRMMDPTARVAAPSQLGQ